MPDKLSNLLQRLYLINYHQIVEIVPKISILGLGLQQIQLSKQAGVTFLKHNLWDNGLLILKVIKYFLINV